MTSRKLRLSICVVTYNHEKYIAKALDSFLMQKTDFSFQVIVGDDCSTDNTTNILREYAKKYPDIIKPIFREKNIGPMNNSLDVYDHAKTEYVAICDGDDYWTDNNKLQKQVDFLDQNKDFSICFHPVKIQYEDQSIKDTIYPRNKYKLQFYRNKKNLLKENFMQTNSIVYRWRFINEDVKKTIPNNIAPGDWYLSLLHSNNGRIGFINEVMSVYNRHQNGLWTESNLKETIQLKYGLEMMKFYYCVYKNITKCNSTYYKKRVLKFFIIFFCVFIENRNFDKVKILTEEYPEEVEIILRLLKKRPTKALNSKL